VRRRDERGAAMVEFAMILPLLVLLTFGIIEFGVAFNASSNVSQSSRAGGRTAAIFSTDPQLEFNAALAAANALDVSPNSITGPPVICVS
jgi:Flp pilus assembly protein TadG